MRLSSSIVCSAQIIFLATAISSLHRPCSAQQQSSQSADDGEMAPAKPTTEISAELKFLFERFDKLKQVEVKDAKPIKLVLRFLEQANRRATINAWLLNESEAEITVLENNLIPCKYSKHTPTVIPASWTPALVKLESFKVLDTERYFKQAAEPDKIPENTIVIGPGPSERALIAYVAWKKDLLQYCDAIIAPDLDDAEVKADYRKLTLDSLAWAHYLRGANLLMFADRSMAAAQFQLVSQISPNAKFATSAADIWKRLKILIAAQATNPLPTTPGSWLSEEQLAEFYVTQLADLHCEQDSQPGDIDPYVAIGNGKIDRNPPTLKLRQMGLVAVPALLKALEDDMPTRTIHHGRDFWQSRFIWRVSDFAQQILYDISGSKQQHFYVRISAEDVDAKHKLIAEAKQWYEANKHLSSDDYMLSLFDKPNASAWLAATEYFLAKKNKRPLPLLVKKIPAAEKYYQGRLCELAAEFGDTSVIPVLKTILHSSQTPADRVSAAIALFTLGDSSGIPVAIEFAKAEEQPHGGWDEPVWLLFRSKTPAGLAAMRALMDNGPPSRVHDVLGAMFRSNTGDLWNFHRQPAGCIEMVPLLVLAMSRSEPTGSANGEVKLRMKDAAAINLVALREGPGDHPNRMRTLNAELFDPFEPDEQKRDKQIAALLQWYEDNKGKLYWDTKTGKLAVK